MISSRSRNLLALALTLLALLFLTAPGCSGGNQGLAVVKGKITYKGNPVGVPTFLLGGAAISGVGSALRAGLDTALGNQVAAIAAVALVTVLFGAVAWVIVRGAAVARRRIKLTVERPTSFVGMFANGGELEPSKMLDFDFWEKEKSRFGGEIVAAVPARDVCWFTGSKPADNVSNLRINTERVHKEAGERAISRLMFLWRNMRWEVL